MGIEKKYGYNTHRLIKDDPYYEKEIAFAETLNNELRYSRNFLDEIVRKNRCVEPIFNREMYDYLTEEEEKAVISAIQWLGTPVGQGFLQKVNDYGNKDKI